MKQIQFYVLLLAALFLHGCSKSDSGGTAAGTTPGTSGQGGSLARFTIARDHLYIVDEEKLYTYKLTNSQHPQLKSTVQIAAGIETIFPFEDKLFIGSEAAMFVYSIADADLPEKLGTASHIRACDPVVANDSLAYVTVRSGSNCGGNVNALMIYNIRNILQPQQVNTVSLASPWGLGLHKNRLYVCNASSGLNVYDLKDPVRPVLLKKITDEAFYDVIITPDDLLIGMVEGGTAIYRIKAGDELEQLSKISN